MRGWVLIFLFVLSSISLFIIPIAIYSYSFVQIDRETTQKYKEEQPQCTSNKVQLSTGHKENEVQEYCYPKIPTDIGKLK